jgi:hypothetical protein
MKRVRKRPPAGHQGSTLIIVLIFIGMFSALAVAMATMSGVNVQVAGNYGKLDGARAAADSGQEVVRFWLTDTYFSGITAPSARFDTLAATLQNNLADANVANIVPVLNGSTITVASVPLDASGSRTFSAVLTKVSNDEVQVDVTGHYEGVDRTLRSNYIFGTRANSIFDYGLGSQGPMHLAGSIDVTALDKQLLVESNALIVTAPGYDLALSMEGRSKIGGSVTLVDEQDYASIGNNAWVGGLKGDAAQANVGYWPDWKPPVEFPEMNPAEFYSWASNPLATATPSGGVWDNLRIPPGLNPTFSGGAQLRGVIYVQTPNIVTFGGGTTITGVIVTNGAPWHNPDPAAPDAALIFGSNVDSFPVTDLPPDLQFTGLHQKIGTFIVAPGFFVEFTGTFGVLSGAIGCNGFKMFGGSGGIINGSIINYSNSEMYLEGNGDLFFNRSGIYEVPAGFVPQTILHYNPLSYTEIPL